jgi:hypothetical protein
MSYEPQYASPPPYHLAAPGYAKHWKPKKPYALVSMYDTVPVIVVDKRLGLNWKRTVRLDLFVEFVKNHINANIPNSSLYQGILDKTYVECGGWVSHGVEWHGPDVEWGVSTIFRLFPELARNLKRMDEVKLSFDDGKEGTTHG